MPAATDSLARDRVVNYIRGANDYNDEDVDSTYSAEARPVEIGRYFPLDPGFGQLPPLASSDASYNTFKTTQAGRV